MPNLIAYGALLAWPLITVVIFATMTSRKALIWSLLLGYLLLPVGTSFDFSGVPALDKTTIANLSALAGALIYGRKPVLRLPREWWLSLMIVAYIFSPMATVFANQEPLIYGNVILQGLRPYDAVSTAAYKAIDLIPFILGYNLLDRPEDRHEVMRIIVIAALGYSLLMLIEIRLSPQLHNWIYGFFPHNFGQQMRGDGFRPVVFLGHGLLVAIFASMAIVSAAYLAQRRAQVFGVQAWLWLVYLSAILVLCKSLGALLLAVAGVTVMYLCRAKQIIIICSCASLFVLAYPMLRGANLVPVQALADQITNVSADRGGSFQVRIDNENALLKRANEKPMLGWGGYGRNRIYDQDNGVDQSITDGTWIIIASTYGWAGYLAAFGMLCLRPLIAGSITRMVPSSSVAVLSLVMVINLLDLIPNSSLGPLTWLLAGMIAVTSRHRRTNRRPNEGAVSVVIGRTQPISASNSGQERSPPSSRATVLQAGTLE